MIFFLFFCFSNKKTIPLREKKKLTGKNEKGIWKERKKGLINHKGLSMAMVPSQTMDRPTCLLCLITVKLEKHVLRSLGDLGIECRRCLTASSVFHVSCHVFPSLPPSLPHPRPPCPTPILSTVKLHKGSGHDHREIPKNYYSNSSQLCIRMETADRWTWPGSTVLKARGLA